MAERITGNLQENLLHLVCFSIKAGPIIRGVVEPELFSSQIYREIFTRVYAFLDAHKAPPGEAHLPDLVEDLLVRRDSDAEMVERIIRTVLEMQGRVHEGYILAQLETFIRQQRFKAALIKSGELIQEGNIDEAQTAMEEGMRRRLQLFSPGLTLTQGLKIALAGQIRENVVLTGVKQLDEWDLGPARGELHLFIAPPKRAKTWWLVNLAKYAILARLRVVYVTLEISEAQIIQRFLQSIFSLMRHRATVEISRIESDELGRFVRFERDQLKGRGALYDQNAVKMIEGKLGGFRVRDNLLVKGFPTGMLTVDGLRAYLDALERAHNFIPDMVVLDYPDLMQFDRRRMREELGGLFVNLRGLGVERNIIMPVATQASRLGAEAKLLTDTHVAEDWSKIATADTVITYSQTLAEKELGLARLFVSNTRVAERDRFVTLISQAYPTGQFCLSSSSMTDSYWGKLKEVGGSDPERDE